MKMKEQQVMQAIREGRESECLDSRDYARLCHFFPVSEWEPLGFSLKEGGELPPVRKWTRENLIEQLREDVEFGFEKALSKRGISSSFMHSTVKMWLWILDDPLETFSLYAHYGLPLFKAVALKYGFDNPIGDDAGDEAKYSSEGS